MVFLCLWSSHTRVDQIHPWLNHNLRGNSLTMCHLAWVYDSQPWPCLYWHFGLMAEWSSCVRVDTLHYHAPAMIIFNELLHHGSIFSIGRQIAQHSPVWFLEGCSLTPPDWCISLGLCTDSGAWGKDVVLGRGDRFWAKISQLFSPSHPLMTSKPVLNSLTWSSVGLIFSPSLPSSLLPYPLILFLLFLAILGTDNFLSIFLGSDHLLCSIL